MSRVLERLEGVARQWSLTPGARALFVCGSGAEPHRLDAYSDLDFLAIVDPEWKHERVAHLDWLEAVRPLVYRFQNASDAWQVLFDDGLYAEFGVVTELELQSIPWSGGRLVWGTADFAPPGPTDPNPEPTKDWLVGEVLSLLYVGLSRWRRGETLSAWKDVQVRAFHAALQLWDREPSSPSHTRDRFSLERRFELRHPGTRELLKDMLPGYESTRQAALALLAFVETRFDANPAMVSAIRALGT